MKDEGLLVSNLIPYSFQLYSLQSFDYKNKKNEKTYKTLCQFLEKS